MKGGHIVLPNPLCSQLFLSFGCVSCEVCTCSCLMFVLHCLTSVTDGDVCPVCRVNSLVSLTSCGMWVVQTM